MNIKIIEPGGFLHQGERFNENDTRNGIDDITGEYFCKCGWAEDIDGKVKTEPRDQNKAVVLDVQGAKHANTTGEAG